ncbi:MAG: multidrug efflux MFS transporter [Nocardioides sp.]|nr:multidrug efflux MFS transporter [Nocardioides sp.]
MAFAIIVGAMAVIFDSTIVAVAIHDLGADLHAGISTIQWVSTGYLLAMFVSIPLAGWAQQVVGGKRLWIIALMTFLAGSVLCAVAWDAPSLIAFRVLQGLGGGVMMPLMMTLLMQAAHGQNIGKLMATVATPVALGPILGPVIGGLILAIPTFTLGGWQLDDWRWLFLVNVPFCVVGTILAVRTLPPDEPRGGKPMARLDLVGFVLLAPGVAAVVYGLSKVAAAGGFGSADVLVPLLPGLVLVALFVLWAVRRKDAALVDVHLFRHRPLASATALQFLAGGALFGAMLLLPLYWQEVRGASALQAGLLLIPQGVGTLFSRSLAGKMMDRIGPRAVTVAAFSVIALGTLPFAFIGPHTSNIWLGVALFVRGLGLGGAMIPLMGVAFIGLQKPEIPHASIITRVSMQLGGSFGTAILAVVLQSAVSGARSMADVAPGFGQAFWWATGFTVLALLLTSLLPKGASK